MAGRQSFPSSGVERFDEKQFYLDEFRSKTLLFSLSASQLRSAMDYERVARSTRELLANDTRVLLLIAAESTARSEQVLRRLRHRLAEVGMDGSAVISLRANLESAPSSRLVTEIWGRLRKRPLLVATCRVQKRGHVHALAQRLGARLRVHKLVLLESAGGLRGEDGKPLSFMDENLLQTLLSAGQAEWAGLADRRATLEAVRAALVGGVTSVNLCTVPGVSRELFTYEGSGTLFTQADYCRVQRLGIDDFGEVEQLLERGQREGLLKPRTSEETAALIVEGYGATIGARHLAGFCALIRQPYRADNAGEIVGLYTITRFKGEGVGAKLLAQVVADARAEQLDYVFACTTAERAQTFFERHGFVRVTTKDVPSAKWRAYDRRRKASVAVFRMDLDAAASTGR